MSEHLKNKHNLPVQDNQLQDLRNIGYYHGYKGYRFIRKANNPIKFTAFSQIVLLNNFDMQLKGLVRPRGRDRRRAQLQHHGQEAGRHAGLPAQDHPRRGRRQ
ncbi:MAG: Abi family protein, partial [Treponema sp.]|nr:Abi family protein [Treponema sp.]